MIILPLTITLPGERPVSWNQFYKGQHWIYRKILAEDIHQKVALTIRSMGITASEPMIDYPVNIKVTLFYTKTHIDSDNIPAKIYIDGLKGMIISNDDPRYVGTVSTRSQKTTGKNRLEIEITKDEEPHSIDTSTSDML